MSTEQSAEKDRPYRGVTSVEPGCTCGGMAACPQCQERDAASAENGLPRATVGEAIAAWEEKGATSLTVALMAEALYDVRDRLEALADKWDARYGPFPNGFCHSMTIHEATGAVRHVLRHRDARVIPPATGDES